MVLWLSEICPDKIVELFYLWAGKKAYFQVGLPSLKLFFLPPSKDAKTQKGKDGLLIINFQGLLASAVSFRGG